jgi:hypothetical protein
MIDDSPRVVAAHLARWLALAAAPTFALMAALTGAPPGGAQQMPCAAATDMSPFGGMVAMYALMSAFHSPPWLKLIAGWRSAARAYRLGLVRAVAGGQATRCHDEASPHGPCA